MRRHARAHTERGGRGVAARPQAGWRLGLTRTRVGRNRTGPGVSGRHARGTARQADSDARSRACPGSHVATNSDRPPSPGYAAAGETPHPRPPTHSPHPAPSLSLLEFMLPFPQPASAPQACLRSCFESPLPHPDTPPTSPAPATPITDTGGFTFSLVITTSCTTTCHRLCPTVTSVHRDRLLESEEAEKQ